MKTKEKFHKEVAEKVRLTIILALNLNLNHDLTLFLQNETQYEQKTFFRFKVNKLKKLLIQSLISITYNNQKKVDVDKKRRIFLTKLKSLNLGNLNQHQRKNQNSFFHKEKNFDFFFNLKPQKTSHAFFLLENLLNI